MFEITDFYLKFLSEQEYKMWYALCNRLHGGIQDLSFTQTPHFWDVL